MARRYLDILNSITRPLELLADLGRDIDLCGSLHKTTCPCTDCQAEMWVMPSGFYCSNRSCRFAAGSITDFLILWKGDYLKVADYLRQMYPEKCRTATNIPWASLRNDFAIEALAHRLVTEFFLRRRNKLPKAQLDGVYAEGWLKQMGLEQTGCANSVFTVDALGMQELHALLKGIDTACPVPSERTLLLFPYFSNHHTVSRILAYDAKRTPDHYWYECSPARFSYFGLLEGHPTEVQTQLCCSHLTAAQANTHHSTFNPDRVCYGLHYDAGAIEPSFFPEHPLYLYKGELLSEVAALAEYVKDVRVVSYDKPSDLLVPPSTWEDFLVDQTIGRLNKHNQVTADVQKFVETSKMSLQVQGRIVEELRKDGNHDLAKAMEVLFDAVPVYATDKLTIFAANNGYQAQKKGEAYRHGISNFTLKLERNITFPGTTDLYHEGQLLFDNDSLPIMINSRNIDSPREIENLARGVEARFNAAHGMMIPSIYDRDMAKPLLVHLRTIVSKLPREEGTPFLGWDYKHTSFHGPFWRTTLEGHAMGSRRFHPEVPLLESYASDTRSALSPKEDVVAEMPQLAVDIISQILALIARSYMQYPVQAIPVLHTNSSRQFLKMIFRALGQIEPVRLNFNTRGTQELKGCNGYPFYGAGYTQGQVLRSTLPGFLLAEEGVCWNGECDPAIGDKITRVLLGTLLDATRWLIRTEGQEFNRSRSPSYTSDLLQEGSQIIAAASNFHNWRSRISYGTLDRVLRTIRFDDVQEFFSDDFAQQVIYFDVSKLPGEISVTDLELELSQLAEACVLEGAMFRIDALSARKMLENFYQTPPRLKVLSPPTAGLQPPHRANQAST